jgi:crotonobetainyl-CoA:carnitine CoA-transferase CaiB-like acyl-CoA transferase
MTETSSSEARGPWCPPDPTDERPLAGLRILELATIIAGPFAGMLLADFGADVIKVEHPAGDPARALGNKKNGSALDWKRLARNKRLVALDLHDPEAQATVRRLAATADVVIENFRPGTLERWGLGWDRLSADNPGLVLLRVTGWGQDGPYAPRPGFGSITEAMAGFAAINGDRDGPPLLPPFGLADHLSGLYGAFSILTALRERDRSGRGQVIDLAIYESLFSILGSMVIDYDQLGFVQERMGNRVHYSAPRNVYRTADDEWVALSGSTPNTARRVFTVIGRPELADDPRFLDNAARLAHADELDALVAEWIGAHPLDEVLTRFEQAEVALAPVQAMDRIFTDPHFLAREAIVSVPDPELGPIRMQGVFPKLTRTPGRIAWAGRRRDADRAAVLSGGGSAAESASPEGSPPRGGGVAP